MPEPELTTIQALAELQDLMRLAASGDYSPQRLAATTYTGCRDLLLKSELGQLLPGFLRQCLTIYRFKDFIQLYSPSERERVAFVDEAFRAADTRAHLRAPFDVFAERGF